MEKPVRAIIWAIPRTSSTALLKSLSGIQNAKIFNELYTSAFLFGPERLDPAFTREDLNPQEQQRSQSAKGYAFPSSICTYEWIKTTLEKDYSGSQFVLSKEISYCLNQRYESLPGGYRHIFLLRHPSKVFPSWRKLNHEAEEKAQVPLEEYDFIQQPPHLLPPGMAYKEAYDLLEHIKEKQLDENPIIIDADDLVSNPAGILSALCSKLGVPYSDSLLTWDKGTGVVDSWTIGENLKRFIQNTQSFENFRNSTHFKRKVAPKSVGLGGADVTADVQRCVDFSMPFYLKMYEERLKVDQA